MNSIYSTLRWRIARQQALSRDGARCTVSRFFGGACAPGPLHVHHIRPVREGGALYALDNLATTCAAHHPLWEALRRTVVQRLTADPPRCRHWHPTREARELCERRMARGTVAA